MSCCGGSPLSPACHRLVSSFLGPLPTTKCLQDLFAAEVGALGLAWVLPPFYCFLGRSHPPSHSWVAWLLPPPLSLTGEAHHTVHVRVAESPSARDAESSRMPLGTGRVAFISCFHLSLGNLGLCVSLGAVYSRFLGKQYLQGAKNHGLFELGLGLMSLLKRESPVWPVGPLQPCHADRSTGPPVPRLTSAQFSRP